MMQNTSNVAIERYLNSIYQSLARSVELTFKDGAMADGFFGGLDYTTGQVLVRNYCLYGSVDLEPERKVNMSDLKFFVVKRIEKTNRTQPKAAGGKKRNSVMDKTKKEEPGNKEKEHELLQVNNKKASSFSKKKAAKNSRRSNAKEIDNQPANNPHRNQFGFLTDKEISNKNATGTQKLSLFQGKMEPKEKNENQKEKVFEKWKPEGEAKGLEIHELDKFATSDRFDQFELNLRINKEKAEDFTEEEYTTKLQLEEFTEEDIRMADKLAQEILNAENTHDINTNHILEERGLKALVDNDNEEALYSAVIDTSVTFKFRNPKPLPKRKSFYEQIIKNWSKNKRKASELIETLSKPVENKSGNSSFMSRKQNANGSYKSMYNANQTSQYGNVYMTVR